MNAAALAQLILLAMIWGASFLFQRMAVPELGPNIVAFARLLLGALVLVLLAMLLRKPLLLKQNGRDYIRIGLFNSALPFWLFAFASLSLPAGVNAVLNAMVPLFAVLLQWWRGTRPSREKLAGVLMGIVGVCLIVGFGGIPLNLMSIAGFLAGLLAAACYAWSAVEIRTTFANTDPMVVATGSLLGSSLVLLPTLFISTPAALWDGPAWLAVLPLGVLCTGLAYMLYFRLLRDIGSTYAVMVTLLVPIFALLWGVLFLSEHPTAMNLLGTALVLISMALILEKIRLPRFTRLGMR
jgi:drug/metabolite transporter (DMT)-like permease